MNCNRQWLLDKRPRGKVRIGHFRYAEDQVSESGRSANGILVKNLAFHCAPTIRNMMNPPGALMPSIALGSPIMGPAASRIVRSEHPDYPVGRILSRIGTWQDYEWIDLARLRVPLLLCPEGTTPVQALGLYGGNTLAAYFGIKKVCEPREGETLVVSGAAGSTGSLAAQIGKALGCRVIGIAGGASKCAWLLSEYGLDGAIDYKSENVSSRLDVIAPDGVDAFFDNVGGAVLQAVVSRIAPRARIAICGQISGYNGEETKVLSPSDMMRLVYGRAKIQGFLGYDYPEQTFTAIEEISSWISQGKIKMREDVREGFQVVPHAFMDLFEGANKGTLIVMNDI